MPLPANSTISLQGHSRPGEGTTTMPKFAMLVRMTEDTLDALQNLAASDKMDFEFGDKPGIFIRDQFFPMRYDREKDNQELFIRTTMAARPNAPLRLNANVVGKFAVEKVLNKKIAQRVHEATMTAKQHKAGNKVRMGESSDMTNATQKKAPSKKTTPKSTPTIVKSYASAAPNATASTSTPSSAALPKEIATTYRQRLVHYLALGAATVQDIFKEFGGQELDHNTRAGIMDILIAIAQHEQMPKATSAAQATKWELKPQSWLEVRPYQFSGYTDNVRLRVARLARSRLLALKIPDTDPAWEHVKFRAHGHGGASDAAGPTQRPANGISGTAAKAKAGKGSKTKDTETKSKTATAASARKAPVQVPLPSKSNIAPDRASTPVHSAKGKEREVDTEKEEGELSASQTPPRIPAVPVDRRQPGSRPNGASTPSMQPPPIPAPSQPSQPLKRTGPVDARGPRRAPPEPSERVRAAPPIPPPAPAEHIVPTVVKKEVSQQKARSSHPGNETPIPASRSSIQPEKERKITKREREWEKESDRESLTMARREKERESDRESLRVAQREKKRESDRESLRMARREKERESDRESIRMRDRSRAPSDREVAKRRDREYEVVKEKKLKEREQVSRPAVKPSAKRRTPDSSDEESSDWGIEDRSNIRKSSLKAKRDWDGVPAKTSASSSKPIKRESPPPKQRIKRETSPLPPVKTKVPADRRVTVASSSVTKTVKKEPRADDLSRLSTSKSMKKRRASYDYTSSSEEEEAPKPKVLKSITKTVASSHSVPVKNVANTSTSTAPEARPRKRKPAPKLSKRDQLRSRYNSKYVEYMAALQRLVAQKNKLQEALRNGSESASGDSDMDLDLPPLEEIQRATEQHQRLHDELEEIKRNFMA